MAKNPVKENTRKYMESVKKGVNNEKIIFYKCQHVQENELPARLNIYLGKSKRLLLCKVCAGQARNDANLFFDLEWGIKKLEGMTDTLEGKLKAQNEQPAQKWYQRIWSK